MAYIVARRMRQDERISERFKIALSMR